MKVDGCKRDEVFIQFGKAEIYFLQEHRKSLDEGRYISLYQALFSQWLLYRSESWSNLREMKWTCQNISKWSLKQDVENQIVGHGQRRGAQTQDRAAFCYRKDEDESLEMFWPCPRSIGPKSYHTSKLFSLKKKLHRMRTTRDMEQCLSDLTAFCFARASAEI